MSGVKISWVDASVAEQRRMHELAGLFTEKETVDELGLGPVRDTLGGVLFPGSSTLHTRARYMLLVPWFHQLAGADSSSAARYQAVRRVERQFIEAARGLPPGTDLTGLFGRRNTEIQRLASDVYTWLLIPYGIMFDPTSQISRTLLHQMGYDDASSPPLLHPSLPAPPEEFPVLPGGFAMPRNEAQWLQERMLSSAPGTVGAHFLRHRPAADSQYPWSDPAAALISGQAAGHLRLAQEFSTVIHGAQLLYNLLLSQRQQEIFAAADNEQGLRGDPERYRNELALWAQECAALGHWRLEEILALVEQTRRRPLSPGLSRFLREWDRALQRSSPEGVVGDPEAHELIRSRENTLKRSQSRFHNRKLLAAWGGASAAGRLNMRWGSSVRRLLLDIHEGLERTEGQPLSTQERMTADA